MVLNVTPSQNSEHIESHIIEFTNTIKSFEEEKSEMSFPFNEIRGLFTFNNFVGVYQAKSQTHTKDRWTPTWKLNGKLIYTSGMKLRRVFNGCEIESLSDWNRKMFVAPKNCPIN